MRINKIVVASAFFALLLVACGDDSDSFNGPEKLSNADMEVDVFDDLPSCVEKREGKTAYVVGQERGYVCKNGKWVEDGDIEISSASSEKNVKCTDSQEMDGKIIDCRDGQTYRTLKIGERTWMVENLNYKTDNSYCYNDSTEYCDKYGRLYTWDVAKNACPAGWHLPSRTEWRILITVAKSALKSSRGWNEYGDASIESVDAYSFAVLPAGFGNGEGLYAEEGYAAAFWSSDGYSSDEAYMVRFGEYVDLGSDNINNVISVRCVKDEPLEEKSSSSIDLTGFETITDERDGQTYKIVVIGSQVWMAQNLNYDAENSSCYNEIASNCTKYGRLYARTTALDSAGTWSTNGKGCGNGSTCTPSYPLRGVCPKGWHLPTRDEWNTLIEFVGGSEVSGMELKSVLGWDGEGLHEDTYHFSALPSSYDYGNLDVFTAFWSSLISPTILVMDSLNGNSSSTSSPILFLDALDAKKCSEDLVCLNELARVDRVRLPVRCLNDELAEQISSSSVTLSSSSSVIVEIGEPLTDTRDGQSYETVVIGSQTWMANNLNYETDNSFCYGYDASNCAEYGRLYTWAAAMDSAVIWSTNGKGCGFASICSPNYPVRGVCPNGWHLPSREEFETLFTAVGGKSTMGKLLKSSSGWNDEGNGVDAVNFAVLPTGFKTESGFYKEGDYTGFWSSTANTSSYAYDIFLRCDDDNVYVAKNPTNYAMSVRCVKD